MIRLLLLFENDSADGLLSIGRLVCFGHRVCKNYFRNSDLRKRRMRDRLFGVHVSRTLFQITLIHVLFFTREFLHTLGTLQPVKPQPATVRLADKFK